MKKEELQRAFEHICEVSNRPKPIYVSESIAPLAKQAAEELGIKVNFEIVKNG